MTHEQVWAASGGLEGEDHEADIWSALRAQPSLAAREALFMLYLPFARRVARRHHLAGSVSDIEFSDLCQLAATGLLESIDRFDPTLGVPFKSYAFRRIAGSVLDGIVRMSEVREQVSFRKRVRHERARSLGNPDHVDGPAAVALQQLADLAVGLALGFMIEGAGLYVLEDEPDRQATAYDSLAWKESVTRAMDAVSQLPDREALVIRQHYLSGLTFEQIGMLLGVTKSRVSQLHRAALERLRAGLPRADTFHLER
jgi:RNA polymerase sigma factor for flagellar operon FliA